MSRAVALRYVEQIKGKSCRTRCRVAAAKSLHERCPVVKIAVTRSGCDFSEITRFQANRLHKPDEVWGLKLNRECNRVALRVRFTIRLDAVDDSGHLRCAESLSGAHIAKTTGKDLQIATGR